MGTQYGYATLQMMPNQPEQGNFYGLGYTFKANIYPKQDNWTGQIAYGEGKNPANLLIYMCECNIFTKNNRVRL